LSGPHLLINLQLLTMQAIPSRGGVSGRSPVMSIRDLSDMHAMMSLPKDFGHFKSEKN